MFVDRNKNKTDKGKLNEDEISPSSFVEPKAKINTEQVKSYKEQAILVIKLLKESGTDIYAEGRYGGMYLHQKNNNKSKISENLKEVFSEKKDKVNNEDSEDNLRGLFNVLKSK